MESDEVLMIRISAYDDSDAFAELVNRHEARLLSYIKKRLANVELARDALQQTFMLAYCKRSQFDHRRKVSPWLYRIARNVAVDAHRATARHDAASIDGARGGGDPECGIDPICHREAAPFENVSITESSDRLMRAIKSLPPRIRSVVTLIYLRGMRYREVAELEQIPLGTVKDRRNSAIKLITKYMSQGERR